MDELVEQKLISRIFADVNIELTLTRCLIWNETTCERAYKTLGTTEVIAELTQKNSRQKFQETF